MHNTLLPWEVEIIFTINCVICVCDREQLQMCCRRMYYLLRYAAFLCFGCVYNVRIIVQELKIKNLFIVSIIGRNGIIFTIVKWIVSNFSQPDGWRKIVSTIIAAIMIVGCFASYPLLTGLCCVALGFFLVVMAHCIHFVRCYDWVIYVQPIFDVVYKVIMFCIWIGQAYYRDAVKSFFTKLKPVHKQKLRGVSSLLPNQTLPKLNF